MPSGALSGSTHPKLVASSSYRSTLAAWRNAAPSSSSSRKLTQSDSLSSNASQSIRHSQPVGTVSAQPAPPKLCTQPPTSSPSKRQSMTYTSQTDISTQEDKRMPATLAAVLSEQKSSDVDMDIDSSLPGDVQPAPAKCEKDATPKRPLRGPKVVLAVEILRPVRRSSRTPARSPVPSPALLKTPAKSPGLRASPRTRGDSLARTPIKSAARTHAKTSATIPSDLDCITPASSVLSDVSSHSPLRVSQNAPVIPEIDEQLDRLQDLCKDVIVTYSDGPDIQPLADNMPGSATPKQAPTSMSSISRALATRDTLITPRSQKSADQFSDSSPRLSVPSSLPQNSHRDPFFAPSPSKRASMMRTWSGKPMPNSVHVMRHQNVLVNAAGKRKVPGTPIAEEPKAIESPFKRQHLSSPEKPKVANLEAPNPATPKPRARPKPIFATSSPRNLQINAGPPLPVSPARSIMTNHGSAPTTPFNAGSGIFTYPNTAQGSPMQEYDTDKSYVSSSVIEEKMTMLIPYQRPEPTALSQEHFKMDVVNDHTPDVPELDPLQDVVMEDGVDESGDDVCLSRWLFMLSGADYSCSLQLMAIFGDFEWSNDAPQPVPGATSVTPLSDVPATTSIEDTDETLIDQVLQGSPSINLSTDDASRTITSPNSDSDAATDSKRAANVSKGGVGNQKALDMFAQLQAKHEQEEEEKRKRDEEVRKKMLKDDSDDDDDDDSNDNLTSLLE
ncbi:hypothetical protein QFC22_005118 [Naganishia vaughanmartiniae]|uniref:Uncharacterized protein n=1 Tax=Naganishia vaughanmartiniae TaxID=1424756 RepID=A0ACC2WW37_9TREE|nr:hypothetical protein QFC22_005118 [Naganishia vaughanmartiniae]